MVMTGSGRVGQERPCVKTNGGSVHGATDAAQFRPQMWLLVRLLAFAVALCLAITVVSMAGAKLENRPRSSAPGPVPIYLPQARFLRPLSLGYQRVVADVLWFRTISYFGEHYRSDHTYTWLAYMCDLVTDLDPRADYVYRFGGMILPWETNQVDQGIQLLEKGAAALPDSWLLHYWLGFAYYFFKEDYTRASAHMWRAAKLPGADPIAAALAALLSQHRYGPETTLRFLYEMAEHADSHQMREVVQRHIRETQLTWDLERLGAAVEAYRARFGKLPANLPQLVDAQLLAQVPIDPYGGVYEVDPETGNVRSSTGQQPSELHRSGTGRSVLRGESPQH
jgi:tetratricopeptide (TPR) repeat protein